MSQSTVLTRAEYEDLVKEHMSALFRTAVRLTGDSHRAEDLVGETLLKGLRFLHRFERGTRFKAWIFTILNNAFVNQYRKEKRTPVIDDPTPAENQAAVTPPSSAALDLSNDSEQIDGRILAAIQKMPEHLKTVFLLVGVEELSYQEAADALDIPTGTIMSRLFRARKHLQERLAPFAEDEGVGSGGGQLS